MSWAQWPNTAMPQPGVVQAPLINPAPNVVNPAVASVVPSNQYTPEQWAQMQQQNWQQWAQWQQQFQQWQQQYGAEYQKSISAMAQATPTPVQPPVPFFNASAPPPLPTETKPPPPPDDPQTPNPPAPAFPSSFLNGPPPPIQQPQPPPPTEQFQNQYNQQQQPNNQGGYQNRNSQNDNQQRFGGNQNFQNRPPVRNQNWQNQNPNNRNQQTFSNQPPAVSNEARNRPDFGGKRPFNLAPDTGDIKRNKVEPNVDANRWQPLAQKAKWGEGPSVNQAENPQWSAKPPPEIVPKRNPEELTEQEKKFDKQFAEWESQFQKWKEQNANHPDKEQYREYEKKWETWRTQLLERREQMKRKRLGLVGSPQPTNIKPDNGQQKDNSQSTCSEGSFNRSYNTAGPTVSQPPQASPRQAQIGPQSFPPTNAASRTGFGNAPQNVADAPNLNRPPPDLNDQPLSFSKSQLEFDDDGNSQQPEHDSSVGQDDAEGFLRSTSTGGIPGLDLVKDGREEAESDLDLKASKENEKGPDLEAISRGINSILGDQKLLNMLSLVSQNQNRPVVSNMVDTVSSIKVGSPKFSPPDSINNEQSNQENAEGDFYEDKNPKEVLSNIDEQTRSSFNVPNDADALDGDKFVKGSEEFSNDNDSFGNNRGPGNWNREPEFNRNFSNFNRGPQGDDFSGGFNRPDNFKESDNFNKPPPDFNRGPNSFQRDTDNFNRNMDNFSRSGNFNRGPGGDFNRSFDDGDSDNFNRGSSDNFNRGGPDNFNRGGPDNLNKAGLDNFNRGRPSFNREGLDNFSKGGPDTFNRGGPANFNSGGPDAFNKGGLDAFNKGGPDAFNKGGLDAFNKGGPDAFNKGGPDAFNKGGPDAFNKGGPDAFNKGGPDNFNRGLDNFNRGPNNFNRGNLDSFNRGGPDNFNRGGTNFNRGGLDNFNRGGPDNFNRGGPDNFNRGGQDNFNRGGPNNFNRGGPDNFNRSGGPDNFNRGGSSDNFNRSGPDNFNRGGPDSFNRGGPENFNRAGPESFNRGGPDNFNRGGSDNFNRGGPDNFNRAGPDNFNRGGLDNFNRGGPDAFKKGGLDNFNRDPDNFNRGPGNFQRDQDNFNKGFDRFERFPSGNYDDLSTNRGGKGFNNFNRDDEVEDSDNRFDTRMDTSGGDFDRFGRNSDNLSRGPESFNEESNNSFDNRDPEQFTRPGQINRGFDNSNSSRFEPPPLVEWNRNNNAIAPDSLLPNLKETPQGDAQVPVEEEIWKPKSVTDYDHKPLKAAEPDVIVESVHTFDYRHKPLNRIPYPQRPKWLTDMVKNYPEFDVIMPRPPPFEQQLRSRYPVNERYESRMSADYQKFDRTRKYYDDHEQRKSLDDRDRKSFDDRDRKSFDDRDRKSFNDRDRKSFDDRDRKSLDDRDRKSFDDRDRKSLDDRDRKSFNDRDRKSFDDKDRKSFDDRDRKSFDDRDRKSLDDRDRKSFDDRPRKPFDDRDRKSYDDYSRKPYDDRDKRFREDQDRRSYDDREKKPYDSNQSKRSDDRRSRDFGEKRVSDSMDEKKSFGRDLEHSKNEDFAEASRTESFSKDTSQNKEQRGREEESFNMKTLVPPPSKSNITLIEDLLCPPGRYNRAPRLVIILRGPPGSGKSFLAKLIKDKEVENGGSAPRILCLDDYFMVEQEKEVEEDGRKVKVKEMVYEYEECMEASYRQSLMKSFKKTITDGYFNFIIVDNINDKVKYFGEMWSFAKQNGFQVYICQLELDVQTCTKRNIHGRSEIEIDRCVSAWEPTPSHHPSLDATSLIQSGSIPEVEMEEIDSPPSENMNEEEHLISSKWDNIDYSNDRLAKLDGTNKPLRPSRTMEDYLQLDNEWIQPVSTKPGQKRVRWADLEERKEQEKMRAIGFVVGQTNWDRMMDPTMGSGALTQTKYIERYN